MCIQSVWREGPAMASEASEASEGTQPLPWGVTQHPRVKKGVKECADGSTSREVSKGGRNS